MPTAGKAEQREYARTRVTLSGKLFVPAGARSVECTVIDLSAGGAAVQCTEPPALNSCVVLYIDGFGRYEAFTTRCVNGVLGLRFRCSDAKRKQLIQKLNLYVSQGVTNATQLRKQERVPIVAELCFTRPSGDQVNCDVLDISGEGFSLKTKVRPPINELIQIGRTYGRVVRHHKQGIGVQFVLADGVRVFS